MNWMLLISVMVVILAVAAGGYFYWRTQVDYVPYPTCNAGNYVWNIKFVTTTFENMYSLIQNLASRMWETGPSYDIYIKNVVIGTVNNGKFTASNSYANVTPGMYRLNPITATNLCQSQVIKIAK